MKRSLCVALKSILTIGIKKKLLALGRTAKHQAVQLWIESIVRHAYWCPKTSGDDGELCFAKWMSMVNHIVDVHEHDNSLQRDLLQADDILMAPALLKDIPKLSYKEQTFGLEAFHSVLIHFISKTCIAVLHHNENAVRAQCVRGGSKAYRLKASKTKKYCVTVPVMEAATYDYARELTEGVLALIQRYPTFKLAKQALNVEVHPARASRYGEKPNLAEAVEQHRARFHK
ncbi:uncharacterized protein LOC135389483 [Ornithodoros turicata]|uniref:uncharacterized protein LOC135389483 n=1 Tax=Ornithodoros turicata TaxID=34597 RepID=UPI003138AD59